MNLAIDIGNTFTKIGVFDGGKLLESTAFEESSAEQGLSFVGRFSGITDVILCDVSNRNSRITNYLKEKAYRIFELESDTPLPIKNLYGSPETLGKDRIASATGAYTIYPGKNVLIIDAGTAVTFDVVNAQGEFLGGNISPGLEMRFRALNEFTGRLPRKQKSDQFTLLGHDSDSAIIGGVVQGLIFEMEGYILRLVSYHKDLIVILTGGDANFFEKKLKKPIFVIPNLILTGLNHILHYNEK